MHAHLSRVPAIKTKRKDNKMLLNLDEVKAMIKEIPAIAQRNAGIQMLIKFVGKTVGAVNDLDTRLKKVEEALGTQPKSE